MITETCTAMPTLPGKKPPNSITRYLNKWPDFKKTGQPVAFMEASLRWMRSESLL